MIEIKESDYEIYEGERETIRTEHLHGCLRKSVHSDGSENYVVVFHDVVQGADEVDALDRPWGSLTVFDLCYLDEVRELLDRLAEQKSMQLIRYKTVADIGFFARFKMLRLTCKITPFYWELSWFKLGEIRSWIVVDFKLGPVEIGLSV